MNRFFVTASGTEIGKTLVMTTLCWQLRQQGKRVTALKPVISGFDPKDSESDTMLILQSCGIEPKPQLLDAVSPWRFRAPLAPNHAAAREGKKLDLKEIVTFCRDHEKLETDIVLAEGAGGVMSPLTDTYTMLDWIDELRWPVILVAGNYLGSISHTLTAAETLKSRGAGLHAVVVCEAATGPVAINDTVDTLAKFLHMDIPVVKLPRLSVTQERWKQAPLISWICT
jgi:dethiobiotin synthetase